MWMLPRGPIENMVDLLEGNGAIIVPCDFGTDLLDALSQRTDGMPVLMYVNVNAPADRVRLTLAHELAHMVLHTTALLDDDTMEEEAMPTNARAARDTASIWSVAGPSVPLPRRCVAAVITASSLRVRHNCGQ